MSWRPWMRPPVIEWPSTAARRRRESASSWSWNCSTLDSRSTRPCHRSSIRPAGSAARDIWNLHRSNGKTLHTTALLHLSEILVQPVQHFTHEVGALDSYVVGRFEHHVLLVLFRRPQQSEEMALRRFQREREIKAAVEH